MILLVVACHFIALRALGLISFSTQIVIGNHLKFDWYLLLHINMWRVFLGCWKILTTKYCEWKWSTTKNYIRKKTLFEKNFFFLFHSSCHFVFIDVFVTSIKNSKKKFFFKNTTLRTNFCCCCWWSNNNKINSGIMGLFHFYFC